MTMNRRNFLHSAAAFALATKTQVYADSGSVQHQIPPELIKADWYVETEPVPEGAPTTPKQEHQPTKRSFFYSS